jgi:hypothetical protein
MPRLSFLWASTLIVCHCASFAATQVTPQVDDEVLEILSNVTLQRPKATPLTHNEQDPNLAVFAVRNAIAMARQTGESRYWGRAQASMQPWWDLADAPVDLAVLQATVLQGRHEFAAARKILTAVLVRAPGNAQAWLTLAALERLSANYGASLAACDSVGRAGASFYASACRMETQSLQGLHRHAMKGLQALLDNADRPEQRSWILSLLAESEERAGLDARAARSYERSLEIVADMYTSIAFSDLLLRTGEPAKAFSVLSKLPSTDAVILRRGAAWRRQGDVRWMAMRSELRQRTAELLRRGDDPSLHGREMALAALWLDDDAPRATLLANANLKLQREPLDWWVALRSATAARDSAASIDIAAGIDRIGLRDVRLISMLSVVRNPTAKDHQ